MNKENISLENILIISDDIYLHFGRFLLRGKGGNGGHNGLKNIEEKLGTSHYARLRFGIGHDFLFSYQKKMNKVNYVLGNWNEKEYQNLLKRLSIGIDIIFSFILNGLQKTMNLFNKIN